MLTIASIYHGLQHSYIVRRARKDVQVKLHIRRELMDLFVQRCGAINTRNLPHLTVAEQGGGWYDVFVIREDCVKQVMRFLNRLTLWLFRRNQQSQSVVPRATRYCVEAPRPLLVAHRVADTPVQKGVDPNRQTLLATIVNSRFGH